MNISDYLKARGMALHALSQAACISYSTLHGHIKHGKQLSVETAKRLEEWSCAQPEAETVGVMTAAEVLGLGEVDRNGTDG